MLLPTLALPTRTFEYFSWSTIVASWSKCYVQDIIEYQSSLPLLLTHFLFKNILVLVNNSCMVALDRFERVNIIQNQEVLQALQVPHEVYKYGCAQEHKTCAISAAERLRLMRFDNRLIIDSFQNANIIKWQFSINILST